MRERAFSVAVEGDVRLFASDGAVNDVGRACAAWLLRRGLVSPGEFAARKRLESLALKRGKGGK